MADQETNEVEQENEDVAQSAVFGSVGQADEAAMMDTLTAARKGGLTDQVPDESHILCQRPDSYELVDIFPDGSWEYQDVLEDGSMRTMSGLNAALLAMYLHSEENKLLFEKIAHEGTEGEGKTPE